MTENCGYYGSYHGKLLGKNLVTYIIDEAFNEAIERNKKKLLIDVKEDFTEYLKSINFKLNDLTKRIKLLEKRKKNECIV